MSLPDYRTPNNPSIPFDRLGHHAASIPQANHWQSSKDYQRPDIDVTSINVDRKPKQNANVRKESESDTDDDDPHGVNKFGREQYRTFLRSLFKVFHLPVPRFLIDNSKENGEFVRQGLGSSQQLGHASPDFDIYEIIRSLIKLTKIVENQSSKPKRHADEFGHDSSSYTGREWPSGYQGRNFDISTRDGSSNSKPERDASSFDRPDNRHSAWTYDRDSQFQPELDGRDETDTQFRERSTQGGPMHNRGDTRNSDRSRREQASGHGSAQDSLRGPENLDQGLRISPLLFEHSRSENNDEIPIDAGDETNEHYDPFPWRNERSNDDETNDCEWLEEHIASLNPEFSHFIEGAHKLEPSSERKYIGPLQKTKILCEATNQCPRNHVCATYGDTKDYGYWCFSTQ